MTLHGGRCDAARSDVTLHGVRTPQLCLPPHTPISHHPAKQTISHKAPFVRLKLRHPAAAYKVVHTRPEDAHRPLLPQSSAKPLPTRARPQRVLSVRAELAAPTPRDWPYVRVSCSPAGPSQVSRHPVRRDRSRRSDGPLSEPKLTLNLNVCFAGRGAFGDAGNQQVGCARGVQVPLTVRERSIFTSVHVAAVHRRKCL